MERAGTESARPRRRAGPPEHSVRHCFWKYPLIAAALLALIVVLAFTTGSPNWPRDTIARVSTKDPGGAILAFTQELDGTASSWANTAELKQELGTGDPGRIFVLDPAGTFAPLLGSRVVQALSTYKQASPDQQRAWATAYEKALGSITPMEGGGGGMETTAGPDYGRIGTLRGDFGPVPTLLQADLTLAQRGYLESYLVGVNPGHSFHLPTVWLYDHPSMLNTAVANGLTDDQWGMLKERGFPVGPWYLIIPAIIHVKLPGGTTGSGFVLWNLLIALLFILAVPLVPGLRDLPRYLGLHRLMYRYPARDNKEGLTVPAPKSLSDGERK